MKIYYCSKEKRPIGYSSYFKDNNICPYWWTDNCHSDFEENKDIEWWESDH